MSYRCDGNTTFVFTYRQASHQNVIQKVIRLAGLYTGNIPTKMKTNRWWEAKTLTVMKHYKSIHSLYILFNTRHLSSTFLVPYYSYIDYVPRYLLLIVANRVFLTLEQPSTSVACTCVICMSARNILFKNTQGLQFGMFLVLF